MLVIRRKQSGLNGAVRSQRLSRDFTPFPVSYNAQRLRGRFPKFYPTTARRVPLLSFDRMGSRSSICASARRRGSTRGLVSHSRGSGPWIGKRK